MVGKARGKYFNSKGKILLLMRLCDYLQNTCSHEDWARWPRGRQALTVWPLSGSTTSKKGFHYGRWEVLPNLRESATVILYFTGSAVGNMKGMNTVWKTHAWQSHKGHLRKWCPPPPPSAPKPGCLEWWLIWTNLGSRSPVTGLRPHVECYPDWGILQQMTFYLF